MLYYMEELYYEKYLLYKKKYNKLLNKTHIDFITKNKIIRININDDNKIDKILKKYFNKLKELIILDFHGVTDLYDDNENIPSKLQKCVISYIGGNPKTIENTTNSIKKRLETNEIILGIIVYNKDLIPSLGTKGWIISKIINIIKNIKIHFIDDSKKNIECVNNIKSDNIITYFINKYKNPKIYLNKLLNKTILTY